jgi:cell division initiation protein
MSEQTRFRILKKGYDRFAVDEKIDALESELQETKKKLEVFQHQSTQSHDDMQLMKRKYTNLVNELIVKENAADDIARLALREANVMIERAGDHADLILKEALATAKTLLSELVRIAGEANNNKNELKGKLAEISDLINGLEFPCVEPFKWIANDNEQDSDITN